VSQHRVPVVLSGSSAAGDRFAELLADRREEAAGCEGLLLELRPAVGPEPSVLVHVAGTLYPVLAAVYGGHAAVTADLAGLAAHPVELAVLRADRRLGVAAALCPGLPLVALLERCADTGEAVTELVLEGPDAARLVDEAVLVSALLGQELAREHVRVAGDPGAAGRWRAVLGTGLPQVRRADGQPPPRRTVTVRTAGSSVTLSGPVGGAEQVAHALLADVRCLARQHDTAWRAHRRATRGTG
jgi:hypothetical protein